MVGTNFLSFYYRMRGYLLPYMGGWVGILSFEAYEGLSYYLSSYTYVYFFSLRFISIYYRVSDEDAI